MGPPSVPAYAEMADFYGKAFVIFLALTGMTLLVLISTWSGALLGGWIGNHPPTGTIPLRALSSFTIWLLASACLLVEMQTKVTLRFSNFVVSLLFGIGGTMVGLAIAITGTTQANWFPRVLPMKF